MALDGEKGWIKDLLDRMFGAGEQAGHDAVVIPKKSLEDGKEEVSSEETLALAEIGSAALSVSGKLAALKDALQFDDSLRSGLDEVRSPRDLLLYMNDMLLSRLIKLGDIGLIGAESSKVLDSVNEKFADILSSQRGGNGCAGIPNAEELHRENIELKQRIEHLHSKYASAAVTSGEQLGQESENRYLQSMVREQQAHLKIAKQKLQTLASYQEMVQSLRARNSLLNSKLENQSKLLRSLTATNPKQQELVSTIEKLNDENKKLKLELEKQSELLSQLKTHLPVDAQQVVEDLINNNSRLHADLERKEVELEGVAEASEGDLLEHIERLSEQNSQLKSTLQTRQSIDEFIRGRGEGGGNPSHVIKTLKMENQRLEETLKVREEQIKVLTRAPQDRQLLKAYLRLRDDYKQVFREGQFKDQLYQQEQNEKQGLVAQARERTLLIKENQKLKTEFESNKRMIEVLKKSEHQLQALRREHLKTKSKCEKTQMELENVKSKLEKVTKEHNLLIRQYENVFER